MKLYFRIAAVLLAGTFISCERGIPSGNEDGNQERTDWSNGANFVKRMAEGREQTLVVYGTSVSSMEPNGVLWVKTLGEELNKRYDNRLILYNNGKSGQNSEWALKNLNEKVLSANPDAVIIEFATNDAVIRFNISLDDCRANTLKLVNDIKAEFPECEVILHTVCGYPLGANLESRPKMAAYNNVYREIADELDLMYIDESEIFRNIAETKGEAVLKKFQGDGVHPTEKGALEIICPNVLKSLTGDKTIFVNTDGTI